MDYDYKRTDAAVWAEAWLEDIYKSDWACVDYDYKAYWSCFFGYSRNMLIMTTSHTDATSHDDSAVLVKVMYD